LLRVIIKIDDVRHIFLMDCFVTREDIKTGWRRQRIWRQSIISYSKEQVSDTGRMFSSFSGRFINGDLDNPQKESSSSLQ
jgi:hypothetical protein